MARFKRKARRAYAVAKRVSRRARAYVKTRSHRGGSKENVVMSTILPAAVYGAVRGKAKEYTKEWTDKLPDALGDNKDELAYGALGYLMYKKGSGFVKNAGAAILTVEAASLANNIASPMMSGASSGASSSQNLL